jgi:hypothetical protein
MKKFWVAELQTNNCPIVGGMHFVNHVHEALDLIVQLALEQGSEDTPEQIKEEAAGGYYSTTKFSDSSICWGEVY